MKKCPTCKGKGFIESTYAKNATFYPSLKRCPADGCPHEKEYQQEVSNRYSKAFREDQSSRNPQHQTIVKPTQEELEGPFSNKEECAGDMPTVNYKPTPINFPESFVKQFEQMEKETNGQACLMLTTNIGSVIVKTVEDAKRITRIVDKYVQHGDLLSWCDQFENVTVFP